MNMAEYILVVVNFEPIKRRLKNDNFDWDAGVKSVSYKSIAKENFPNSHNSLRGL